jgi:P27 family predicted phage terminase small subunit
VRSKQRTPAAAGATASSADAVDPPAWLVKDGLKIWHRLAPTLRHAKLLTRADVETFARYCRNFARWLKMQHTLDTEGETYETETYGSAPDSTDGAPPRVAAKLKRAHPAFLISDRLERQLLAAEDRFGLNPAERQRIFAARAQTGATGDLFSPMKEGERRPGDPAAQAISPAEPIESPVGLLN